MLSKLGKLLLRDQVILKNGRLLCYQHSFPPIISITPRKYQNNFSTTSESFSFASNRSNYSDRAWSCLSNLMDIAKEYESDELDTEHLLLSILISGNDHYLQKIQGLNISQLKQELHIHLKSRKKKEKSSSAISFSPSLKSSLKDSLALSQQKKEDTISLSSLLQPLLSHPDSLLFRHIQSNNSSPQSALNFLQNSAPPQETPSINQFCIDLTQQAADGKIDPVLTRDHIARRVIQVLSRRTKNNPMLVGPPGSGKTAIAECIALRIASQDVPDNLKNKRLVSLDLASLLAGAKLKGQFEERLKQVLQEIEDSDNEIILFIDEIHTIINTGSSSSFDVANILKPALSRRKLSCIGATTLEEYKVHIESDRAFERRFLKILVNPSDVDETITILRTLRECYEDHHGVKIRDNALVAAARLSDRYIGERHLPDKAIDVLDEAACQLRMEMTSSPGQLNDILRRLRECELEIYSLESDMSENGKLDESERARLENLCKERKELSTERGKIEDIWTRGRAALERMKDLKEEKLAAIERKGELEKSGDWEGASKLLYSTIPEIENEISEVKEGLKSLQFLRSEVDPDDIRRVISQWTGIPVTRITESEREHVLKLEERLNNSIIGQERVAKMVAATLKRTQSGMSRGKKPLGSFLFAGPSGVGKTAMCKALAQEMFASSSKLLRFDMSEYMERHTVSKLIGAPPGYVNSEKGGLLTEQVRLHPYSLVLFDEIEKAHPEIMNLLLSVLDEGELRDSMGNVVSFRNTIVILTSNVGSSCVEEVVLRGGGVKKELFAEYREGVVGELKKRIPQELLNRFDDVVVFNHLDNGDMIRIMEEEMKGLRDHMKLATGLEVMIGDGVMEKLIEYIGNKGLYHARAVKRVMREFLEDGLAHIILSENHSIDTPTIKSITVSMGEKGNYVLGDFCFEAIKEQKGELLQEVGVRVY